MTDPELRPLLIDLDRALLCWLHYYAPDQCSMDKVQDCAAYVCEHGGTLAMIARLRERIRGRLKEINHARN